MDPFSQGFGSDTLDFLDAQLKAAQTDRRTTRAMSKSNSFCFARYESVKTTNFKKNLGNQAQKTSQHVKESEANQDSSGCEVIDESPGRNSEILLQKSVRLKLRKLKAQTTQQQEIQGLSDIFAQELSFETSNEDKENVDTGRTFNVPDSGPDLVNEGQVDTFFDLDSVSFTCDNDIHKESFREISLDDSVIPEGSLRWIESPSEVLSFKVPKVQKKMSQTKGANQQLKLNTKENLRLISNWGLPREVVEQYKQKGIEEMFEWQKDCLSNMKVLFEATNLMYSAPTSAGKTLVSEILMIKTCIERRKKGLMILPFISVVREKMFYLRDLLTPAGIRVEGFFGGYNPPGGFEHVQVAICTIEKANSIINRLLENGKLDDLGIIVVDEVHLLSDPSRGYILELLLAKILYMKEHANLDIQIIAMSATIPNIDLLTKWLRAEFFYTDFRPIELREMLKVGANILDSKLQPIRTLPHEEIFQKDTDNVGQLAVETILENFSTLIFVPSKDWCEQLCLNLAQLIHNYKKLQTTQAETLCEILKQRSEETDELKLQLKNCPIGLDAMLEKMLGYGCAYHHAGLTTEERDIIENGFKNGTLKILVATSTLSSGVSINKKL